MYQRRMDLIKSKCLTYTFGWTIDDEVELILLIRSDKKTAELERGPESRFDDLLFRMYHQYHENGILLYKENH